MYLLAIRGIGVEADGASGTGDVDCSEIVTGMRNNMVFLAHHNK